MCAALVNVRVPAVVAVSVCAADNLPRTRAFEVLGGEFGIFHNFLFTF
jgi:hypothetical protein